MTERYQTTRTGCTLSSPQLPVCYGVPQGSILGPLLFTLYINELPNIVSNCEIENYMDDTKLFLSFKSLDTDLELASASQDLHRVVEWLSEHQPRSQGSPLGTRFCEHQLLINPDKTKFIFFSVQSSSLDNFLIQRTLTPDKICKDLCIRDSGLTFDTHFFKYRTVDMQSFSKFRTLPPVFSLV